MNDIARANAEAYALSRQLRLSEQLGFGVHGIVLLAENKIKKERSAIKAHKALSPYLRESAVYERLRAARVTEVLGCHVPQLLRADDQFRVIEMTIVTRPFVLDFAGAYLDAPPHFPDETWREWELQKQEQFGPHWETVQDIMAAFEALDIYLLDVSPSNIGLA